MDFPVSVAGAEIVMKNIEALATYCETHRDPSNFSETLLSGYITLMIRSLYTETKSMNFTNI